MPDHVTPRSRVSEYVDKSDYDTYEILVGSSDAGIPVFIPLTEGTVLGRLTGGEIDALDSSDLIGLIWGTETANTVFAGPATGAAAAPAFRALVAGDIPDLSGTYSAAGHSHAHNDTTSKQGGTTGEYYHLTALQSTSARGIQRLTSAADTTYTLTTSDSEKLVVVGSGVLYWIDLGDATTYSDASLESKCYTIYNATNEFIGVKNSSGSVWHRVPPRAQCVCVLTDNSTAAGVWFSEVVESRDPAVGLSLFEDFCGIASGNNYYGTITISGTVSGAGAAITTSTVHGPGTQGVLTISTGTTTTGYAVGVNPNSTGVVLGNGCRALEVSVELSAISEVAEEYIVRIYMGNLSTGAAHTEGVGLFYDRYNGGGAALLNWQIQNVTGGVATTLDSGVAPTYGTSGTNYQRLRVEVDSALTRSDFWIDRANVSGVGGITTNLPAGTNRIANLGITKSAGTTARYIRLDNLWVQSYPTSFR